MNEVKDTERFFTGERFIPGIQDKKLEIEHLQRYMSIRNIVKDKVVLDAACGEGYGSNLLSEYARKVIGLDIDGETIERAKDKYSKADNLTYIQGSIESLPVEDKSIDVLVSFETIEHVDAVIQQKFLSEIKRVLKDDGILIISTPNKAVYSDLHNYSNPFHIKEFYYDEFKTFLESAFRNVEFFRQEFELVSLLSNHSSGRKDVAYFDETGEDISTGKYYVAIASEKSLDNIDISSVYYSEADEYEKLIDRIITLQNDVEDRNRHINKLDKEIKQSENIIDTLNKDVVERNTHLAKLDREIEEHRKVIEEYRREIELTKKELDNRNLQFEKAIRDWNEEKAQLTQTVRNKEGHIEQLLEVERAFEREKQTKAYKLALKFRRVFDFFFPKNSKRLFFGRVMAKLIRHPRLMFRVISPKRIKNYRKYMKSEGLEGVERRYREAVEEERAHLHPEERLDITNPVTEKKEEARIEDYEKLEMPVFDRKPTVSIIIPVYNEFHYTYNCLNSIIKNTSDICYEVIIANDCSTDITSSINEVVKNVKLITTEKNVRFLLNCNNAARFAQGDYIFFLNNDTQVQKNWLKPLVDLIESDERIGMVGSKLIYPDGRLQEAGGILWKDGSAWNYGHLANPDDPEYNYVKEADYISGAAIMIKRSLWNEIGGFDEKFAPAYYEDTDLAFEVRKHGYKVMYQPASVVVHFEGVSNGTDTASGLKAYQVTNQKKFFEKWKDVLEKDHFPNAENVYLAKDRGQLRKQILVVDHYVPHYDKDAGGRCTFMYLKLFVKMGFKVTFIGDNFYKHEPYTTELNQVGIEVLYGNYYYNNWKDWLKDNLKYFDYVYLQRPHISIKYIDIVKKYSSAKVLYWACDLHHIREMREYEITGNIEKKESAEKWKTIEYELFEKADVDHVVGSYEQGIMQKVFPEKPIRNLPLYIYEKAADNIEKDFSKRKDLLYVGGFGHPPNVDAVIWFANKVFPKVIEKYPNIKWHVVGSKVPNEVSELADGNIIIEGFLSDEELEKLYRSCRMDIVPLRYGAGVKGKVVESAYYQIPLVTTNIGAEGVDSTMGNMVIYDDSDSMANAICSLYEDFTKLKEMSDAGANLIKAHYTLEEAERVLRLDIDI